MANKYLVYEREKQKLLKQQEQGKKNRLSESR